MSDMSTVPEKPALEGLEAKWAERWERDALYRFERSRPRADVFAIDTPPPTVSGSLHIGHVFSSHRCDRPVPADARQRQCSIRWAGTTAGCRPSGASRTSSPSCDPSLPYDPAFQPAEKPGKQPVPVSRPNFIELCQRLTTEDEKAFEALWRTLGLSVDWSMTYATIDRRSQRVSQLAFLRLLARGQAYQLEAPTLWDVDFRTAVAQAELEDREREGPTIACISSA